jgi:phage shock protein PspC (stress-responsive transcriptional regulator)/predicted membrane protein
MDTPLSAGSSAGSPPPPPPFGSGRPRQLRRRPDEGPIAGVCAGVAEYFNVDPVIVRIAAVVLAFSGPGIFAYILAWIFVPEATGPSNQPFAAAPADRRDRGAQIFGIVLLAVSVSILWGGWWSPARRWMFPLGLMALGAWLLLRRGREDDEPPAVSGPPPTPPYPWASAGTETTTTVPVAAEPTVADETDSIAGDTTRSDAAHEDDTSAEDTLVGTSLPGALAAEGSGGGEVRPPWGQGPWSTGPPAELPEAVKMARRRRRMVFPIVLGALLLWTGIAFLADISLQSGLAIALCIVGVGFVLGAFVGGSKALIVPAVLVGGALVASSIVDIPLSGPIGQRTWAPQTVAQVDDHYELSIGEGVLDLTALSIPEGDRVNIDASVGVGHLVIQVPDGVALDVTAEVSGGDIVLNGHSNSGVGVSTERTFSGSQDNGTIDLDLEVGLGQIEVITMGADRSATNPSTTTTLR